MEGPLPRYTDRRAAPRDLRTAEELAANDYTRLGAPRAELALPDGTIIPLYSTTEARRLKHDLWPRGRKLAVSGAPVEVEGTPLGASARGSNPGSTSAPPPGTRRSTGRGPSRGTAGQAAAGLRDPRQWLDDVFAQGFVVLDTETTGLGPRAEIIEIAALDHTGQVLMESKVWPRAGRVPASATRVHGYTIGDLRGSPTWPELLLELERQLDGRRVLAWNAPFDERMALQTSRLWSLAPQLPTFECAMRGYAQLRGVGVSMRLERAAQVERVLSAAQEHRSLADAQLVLAVLKRLAEARTVSA